MTVIAVGQPLNHAVLELASHRRASWPKGKRRKKSKAVRWSLRWTPRWRVFRQTDAFTGQNLRERVRLPIGLEAGPALMLYKAQCEALTSFGALVLGAGHGQRSGTVCIREAPSEEFFHAKMPLPGAWLCMPSSQPVIAEEAGCSACSVIVVTSQDEFDETSYTDPEVDVSTLGNGRKSATHALLRSLLEESAKGSLVTVVAILILDFQADAGEGHFQLQSASELPTEGPAVFEVNVQGFGKVEALRGDFEQLLVAGAGELQADLALCTSVRHDMLTLLHGIHARSHMAMCYDYQVPYGPWGVREAEALRYESHLRLLGKTVLLCTSRHLAEYVKRWSKGTVETRLCYCADYGYFDRFLAAPPARGRCVTFISPCPAKGLCIFLRVAKSLPSLHFLAVPTQWTKSIHLTALRDVANVEIMEGHHVVEDVYARTAVLLVPSLWSEAFGLVAMEAQLRGIPVVSSDHYGLREANMCEDLRVPKVPLVQDMRMRTLHRGQTIEELEEALPPMRQEPRFTEEELLRNLAQTHLYIATPQEAAGFTSRVERLMTEKSWRREKGKEARQRAEAFVQSRHGSLWEMLLEKDIIA